MLYKTNHDLDLWVGVLPKCFPLARYRCCSAVGTAQVLPPGVAPILVRGSSRLLGGWCRSVKTPIPTDFTFSAPHPSDTTNSERTSARTTDRARGRRVGGGDGFSCPLVRSRSRARPVYGAV